MKDFTVGVIISTYNNPRWLEKTLWSYEKQTVSPDEIIIADDGSNEETRRLIENFRSSLPIKHVLHEDCGFRKTEILNEALRAATADYLIFTDQDCMASPDFVETHVRFAEKGYFLSGGYLKLPMRISKLVSRDDIYSARVFRFRWLMMHGLVLSIKCFKLVKSPRFKAFLNYITPAGTTWNGMNSSGWRSDILSVAGFDERMQYGGEDREMGERLINKGLLAKQIRFSALTLHLDHRRPYVNKESVEYNDAIRRETRRNKLVVTRYGL